jgi:undecaprenyl-diphosphatase
LGEDEIVTAAEAFILGIIQGLTEFLPVSSSGHLVIFQHLFGIHEGITFDVVVHLGTLVAVFIAFWDDIVFILRKPFSRISYLILIGIIPAGLAGYLLAPLVEQAFESLLVVGLGLIFTGVVLKYSEWMSERYLGLKQSEETSFKDALFIGCLQALAIIPGISRSGSTIAAGLMAGLDREFVARFSFLLSIPVILGAGVLVRLCWHIWGECHQVEPLYSLLKRLRFILMVWKRRGCWEYTMIVLLMGSTD